MDPTFSPIEFVDDNHDGVGAGADEIPPENLGDIPVPGVPGGRPGPEPGWRPGPGPGPDPEPWPEPWPWPWPHVGPKGPIIPFPSRPKWGPPWDWPVPELPKKKLPLGVVSGRFRSSGGPIEVELRVDVDGTTTVHRLSADYFQRSGTLLTYVGSMRVDAVTVTETPAGEVEMTGVGHFTFAVTAPVVRVRIQRPLLNQAPSSAQLDHLTTLGQPGDSYVCPFASRFFRSLTFEQDRETAVAAPFDSYDTGQLTSGGPGRVLSVTSAYAEAGVELNSTGPMGVVTSGAGGNASWSDAELHAAMESQFSIWADRAQWAAWLFHAHIHDKGTSLLGLMFDQQGHQRQGAAVFYAGMDGVDATHRRLHLYTCVHELGHTFNLLHAWQKSLATPPGIDRPGSFSWMNYPWLFPTGPDAFWNGFGFAFDTEELIHIRHGFRDTVIQGGDPFAVNAALFDEARSVAGLRLDLFVPAPTLVWGSPVTVDMQLTATGGRGVAVPHHLGPRTGTVQLVIDRPDGRRQLYRPMLHHCVSGADTITLSSYESHVDTAFVHFGADGFPFDAIGTYKIRGLFATPSGDLVVSDPVQLVVAPPATSDDARAGSVMFDEQVGALLYLAGSESPTLKEGRGLLQELSTELPEHPMGRLAALVEASTVGRAFKSIDNAGVVSTREADPDGATALLRSAQPHETFAEAVAVGVELAGVAAPVQAEDTVLLGYMRSRAHELDVALGETG